MSIFQFETWAIEFLYEEIQSSKQFVPTITQLFNGENYPTGEPLNSAGLTESEVKNRGGSFWPSAFQMLDNAITPCLQFVCEHGVYLINNTLHIPQPGKLKRYVYATGFDPHLDDNFELNQVSYFGEDSIFIDLPIEEYVNSTGRRSHRAQIQFIDGYAKFL